MKSVVKFNYLLLNFIACLVALPALAVVPVSVAEVTKAPLTSEIAVNGTIYGKGDVTLTAGVNGRLLYVAEPGTHVVKGEPLVRMDTLPLELDKARQQEMLKRAEINVRLYRQELKRLQQLAESSSAAKSQVDAMQNKHDLALSDIALAKVELQVIEDKLRRATINAPFNGVVSERLKRPGRDVNRAEPLLSVLDLENLEVRLYVPVKYLRYLQPGLELPISTGDLSQPQRSNAVVSAVIPSTDPRSQTVEIRAALAPQQQSSWAVGQLVDVTVPLASAKAALLVNRDALILRKQGTHVVKIDTENKAQQVPVRVGSGKGQWVEVIPSTADALNPGDKVAIRGAERLQSGQQVEVQTRP